jgi:hypothetical protein
MVAADACNAFQKRPPIVIENDWAAVVVVYIVLVSQRIVLSKFLKEVRARGCLIREKIRNCGIDGAQREVQEWDFLFGGLFGIVLDSLREFAVVVSAGRCSKLEAEEPFVPTV